jgi:uncharacterized protein YegJ (DUF2314 family)
VSGAAKVSVLAILMATAWTQAACGGEDKAVWLKPGDQSLNTAMAQAKATLPVFWRHVDSDPTIADASVKVGFRTQHGGTEFLWVFVDSHSGEAFRGRIGNEPEDVPSVRADQPYTGKISEIADWSYVKNDKQYGQYTTRALVKQGEFKDEALDLAPTPLEPGDQ